MDDNVMTVHNIIIHNAVKAFLTALYLKCNKIWTFCILYVSTLYKIMHLAKLTCVSAYLYAFCLLTATISLTFIMAARYHVWFLQH